jgi:hypothetical protein
VGQHFATLLPYNNWRRITNPSEAYYMRRVVTEENSSLVAQPGGAKVS